MFDDWHNMARQVGMCIHTNRVFTQVTFREGIVVLVGVSKCYDETAPHFVQEAYCERRIEAEAG